MAEDPTREQILDFLFQHSPASAGEIGSHLGLTPAAVRYHLRALTQEGQAETVHQKASRRQAPGRPGRLYRISTQSQPDNLAALTKILLSLNLEDLSGSERDRFFHELAKRLSRIPGNGYAQKPSLPTRLAAALAFLNKMNYSATWEARSQGPQIIFHNCPYAAVWRSFPDLCIMDTHLVQNLISAPAIRLRSIDPDVPEIRTCLFQVKHGK